ncbi:MAG: tetratricopeptide repeat protein [Chitinophagales bacterium]
MKNALFICLLLLVLPLYSIGQNKDLQSSYQAGEFSECISLSKDIIHANQKSDVEVLEALNYLVICHTWKAEYDKGEIYLNKSNPLITQIDTIKNKSIYINYLFAKGWLLHMTSQRKEALSVYNQALDLYSFDDTKDALYYLIINKIGELYYYHFREIAISKKYFQEALDGFQRVGTTNELDLALCYYDNSVLQQTY